MSRQDDPTPIALERHGRELVDAAWNDHDLDRIIARCAPDVAVHDPTHPTARTGPEAYASYVERIASSTPDDLELVLEIQDVTVVEEIIVVRSTATTATSDTTATTTTATTTAAASGSTSETAVADARPASFVGLDVLSVADGRVVDWKPAFLPTTAVESLHERVRGDVVAPDDDSYDDARAVWNGALDRYPALVVQCTGVADVRDAHAFVREHDVLASVRGGGHNVAGSAVCDAAVVVDCSPMTGIHVDLDAQTVRAEPGVTWGALDRETQAFGLATPGGVVSTTGIAGLTLGGGLGWLRRKHGLTVDSLRSVDLVTLDGDVLTASDREHPDVFWALRGGGATLGVVTSFEYDCHPVGPEVYVAGAMYPLADARDVLAAWREFMTDAPRDVSSEAAFWTIPDVPDFPDEAVGEPIVAIIAVHCGAVDEGRRTLEPLRELAAPLVDLSGPMPYVDVQALFDPFMPAGDFGYYWKSLELDRFDDAVVDAVVDVAADRPSPETIVPIWHLGGAMRDVDADATAYGDRDATYLLSIDTTWSNPDDPDETAANVAWTRDVWESMHRFSDGSLYLNFPGHGEEGDDLARSAVGHEHYERLAALKDAYDPANAFRGSWDVQPPS